MAMPTLSQEQQRKLNNFMDAGIIILQRVEDEKEGLKELAKDLAEQLDVKPALLNKALRTKFKQTLEKDREAFEIVEDLLQITEK